MIETTSPGTGLPLARYEEHGPAEVARRLASAESAFLAWRTTTFAQRAEILNAVAGRLESGAGGHARLMAEEMGKPVTSGEAEVKKCAWACRHYAESAEAYLRPRVIATDATKSYVRYDPLGPVLAVMPWNFPFWQVFRFAAPALMAGNVALLKHASNVTGCALAIESVFREAGLPEGGFQTLVLRPRALGPVVDDERVKAVTLTGSEDAGVAVAAAAGRRIKKTVLELGGSDPYILLADADVERAAEVAAAARMVNSGQSCIAAKRFIVHEKVAGSFVGLLVEHIRALKVGDPLDTGTRIGPLAREDLLETLHHQVDRSRALGAKVLLGGGRLERPGFFYAPTVLADVTPGQPAALEETFGPVAAVMTGKSDDDLVRLANDTAFGLGASLWTRDLGKAESLAPRIEAGSVFVNGLVKSDPRLPFGGVKRSGYGRELGEEGIREFVNIKTVWIA